MRGHYAVGFRRVEGREKRGEGSAWTLCSGLTSGREKGGEGRGECVDTVQWADIREGGGRRGERAVRGHCAVG